MWENWRSRQKTLPAHHEVWLWKQERDIQRYVGSMENLLVYYSEEKERNIDLKTS